METTVQANRYAGPCSFCGAKVPAAEGTYSRGEGARHAEGQCKTTTKTYRQSVARQRMAEFRDALQAVYADAGYERWDSTRIEHPSTVRGHGLIAYVGGYESDAVFARGVRVHRVLAQGALYSDPIHECPAPRYETGDYYADRISEVRELVAILDGLREGAAR